VDTKVELLCAPEGEEVTTESNSYMYKGECTEMESRTEMFIVKPSAGSAGPPDIHEETVYRTIHGPVFARGNVGGEPVAFVKQRFFWLRELDSIPQFYRWNAEVESIADFKAAASKFTMSFNTFYADHKDIGYFHVGYYPKRPKGYHPSLPTWGTGKWEWGRRLPFRTHPQVINPDQGWLANWNNKPAKGWDNYDGIKWGPIQRVKLLQDELHRYMDGAKKAKLSDLVDVIRQAATRDARGVYMGPKMLKAAGAAPDDAKRDQAIELVKAWVGAGSNRLNRDYAEDDLADDAGPATAIFDAWFDALVHAVFDDEIGADAYDLVPTAVSDRDQWHDFSSFLMNTFKKNSRAALARNYCDDISTPKGETCGSQVIKALDAAIATLTTDQGEDMTAWETDAWMIVFQELGLGSVGTIPWQNRGTHNHVVEILRKAGETPAPAPTGTTTPSPSPSAS
jgi:acyl-homoserine lactone acylase PvdQ